MNPTKIKLLAAGLGLSFIITSVSVFAVYKKDYILKSDANSQYSIEMNQGDFDFLSANYYQNASKTFRKTEFKFENCAKDSNGNLQIGPSHKMGCIYNTLEDNVLNFAITGFLNIKVDFKSDSDLMMYFANAPKPDDEVNSIVIKPNTLINISKFNQYRYFSLKTSKGDAIVSSLVINYSCNPNDLEVPEDEIYVKSLEVSHPSEYVINDSININKDFKVIANLSNEQRKVLTYDPNMINGWYFELIMSETEELTSFPITFDHIDEYMFSIAYKDSKNDLSGCYDGNIKILGGAYTNIKPDKVEARLIRDTFNLNETFNPQAIVVEGTWNNLGGQCFVEPGDGQNGFSYTCNDHDLTSYFDKTGEYQIHVSYRGSDFDFVINVINNLEKSTLSYDYNEYGKNNYPATDIMPTKGSPKVLIIPTLFSDSEQFLPTEFDKNQVISDLNKAYFGESKDTGWESVNSYYLKDSYGKLDIKGTISDTWYECGYSYKNVNQTLTKTIARKAGQWYKQQVSEQEWKSFDSDEDGYIDAVILIYGAPYYTRLNEANPNKDLWAYCNWIQNTNVKNPSNPGVNTYFWASYQFMELDTNEDGSLIQSKDNPMKIDTHIYIHEMGHVIGLEDYYDYTGKTFPAGSFSMQDRNVGGHDPYSKLALGWVNPIVPTSSTTITLNKFESSGDVILLTPKYNDSAFDEYLLLEYYTPTGLNYLDTHFQYKNSYADGTLYSGLRVWHVDSRMFGWVNGLNGLTPDSNYYTKYKKEAGLYGTFLAMSNTTNEVGKVRGFVRQQDFGFDQLALLNRKYANKSEPYLFSQSFSNQNLWMLGHSFDMSTYQSQFPNKTKLNSGKELGFTFNVVGQTRDTISIDITKL